MLSVNITTQKAYSLLLSSKITLKIFNDVFTDLSLNNWNNEF